MRVKEKKKTPGDREHDLVGGRSGGEKQLNGPSQDRASLGSSEDERVDGKSTEGQNGAALKKKPEIPHPNQERTEGNLRRGKEGLLILRCQMEEDYVTFDSKVLRSL